MTTKFQTIFFTTRAILDDIDKNRVNADRPYQRELKTHWLNKEVMDKFINTILNGWPLPSFFAVVNNEDNTISIDLIDGKQRLSALNRVFTDKYIYTGSEKSAPEDSFEILPFDDLINKPFSLWNDKYTKLFLDYLLTFVNCFDMSEDQQSELFFRLNKGGILLSGLEASRGKIIGKLNQYTSGLNHETWKGYKRNEKEAIILQTLNYMECKESSNFKSRELIKWFMAYIPTKESIETLYTKVCLLDKILLVGCEGWEAAGKRLSKKIHIQTILSTLTGSEIPEDSSLSLLSFFEQTGESRSDVRIEYNEACHSNTASSENIVIRVNCLTKVLSNDNTCKAKEIIKPIKEKTLTKKEAAAAVVAAASPNKAINQAAVDATTAESIEKLDSVIVKEGEKLSRKEIEKNAAAAELNKGLPKKVSGFSKKHGRK